MRENNEKRRRRSRPTRSGQASVALACIASLLGTLTPAHVYGDSTARAAEVVDQAAAVEHRAETSSPAWPTTPVPVDSHARAVELPGEIAAGSVPTTATDSSSSVSTVAPAAVAVAATVALPSGADKTGVSSQAISIPQGAGKIQGMGESFSAQLSTGVATFTVPFALPAARGAAQPSLQLSYSSSGGQGVAGIGWTVGVPFIARQTDRGIPQYNDPPEGTGWVPDLDRFVFNGGQELVPIGQVASDGSCAGAIAGEVMPSWAGGWMYFRPRVEGSFQRFFWSSNHKTWRVQDKSGVVLELGVPLDGTGYAGALETDPANAARIFRWNLAREYDAHVEATPAPGQLPRPVNVVQFRYQSWDGQSYLTDVYDTSPAANPAGAALAQYAHHTRLSYEERPDKTASYRRGWQTITSRRLTGVDVASHTFNVTGARRQVRRYRLTYDSSFHASMLASLRVEGRCSASEESAPAEDASETLAPSACASLPAMTFAYQHVLPYKTDGSVGAVDLAGYEGFDERIHAMAQSPDYSVDEELTDLFDINSDGLPDVLVTAPGLFGGKHGVFFNGGDGIADSFKAGTIEVGGVLGATANDITLKNLNLSPQDLDGDGTIDLLHMPAVKTYSVYTPKLHEGAWTWEGRAVSTASGQSPKIDFGRDTLDLRIMDVNADGLVDVVASTGTEFQTFFALGRYPGGDGQFGSAVWTGAKTAAISNDPVRKCVPWGGTPVRFSDPDVKLGDMNGDGLVDIVRVRRGDIRYWPGRGNGVWGTGSVDDCTAGTFGNARNVPMALSPQYSDIEGDALHLDDVNGDGLDDLVQVRFDAVDIWLNVDGVGWTPQRHIIEGTPASPSFANRVRLVDVNGSGTRDILWGDGLRYKYIDLAGGSRPGVLTKVSNGLGKTTEIEYSTSTALMLAAEHAGGEPAWTSKAPMPLHVVTRVTERDNLAIVGRPAGQYITEYSYRDPVYDGRQREFRGFASATVRKVGDDNSPTSLARTNFLLGECKDESPDDGVDPCSPAYRWMDSGREALKGLPVLTETFDERSTPVYLSTSHQAYTLRPLYVGLDGRLVRHAFVSQSDAFTYDTAPFVAGTEAPLVVDEVFVGSAIETGALPRRSGSTRRARVRSQSAVDSFGNQTEAKAFGCVEGCADGTDETIRTVTEPGRPAGDTSGWLFRTMHSFVSGDQHGNAARNEKYFTYDAHGDLQNVSAVLSGSLPLKRKHESGPSAPGQDPRFADGAPPFASGGVGAPVQFLLALNGYDAFGNVLSTIAANARCRTVHYDDAFAQLPTAEVVFAGSVGTQCGNRPLTTLADYDRGLGSITTAHDLHGEITVAAYDGFGRVTSLTKPDPTSLVASPLPSVKIEYFLTTDADARPYSLIHTSSQDGKLLTDAEYMESWAYVDGLGRAIVTLAEADPAAGDQGDFVVNGLTEYDNKGATRRKYLAWFYSGAPTEFPLSAPAPSAYGRQRYDAFGRQLETYGLDGSVTLRSAYHALAADQYDAADIEPGPHQGTYATARSDGHGRALAAVERIHVGNAIEAREIRTSFLPTGEPEVITRERMSTHDIVVRWMRYDSLGRMVLNVEPNTTANFNPSPQANADAMDAWRYAYNNAGDLVGTSDARGCGVNYHYEGAGRIVGEDYSPCLAAHAAYTPANPANGAGFEVFYHYDTAEPDAPTDAEYDCNDDLLVGRLVSVADRGSKVVTCYDGRGRVTAVGKRIAKPDAPNTLVDRYAPRWYVKSATFDAADRAISETTGARVAELLVNGQSRVTTDYSRRGIVKSVGGSYGSLVASVVKDADGLTREITYGDVAATKTSYNYDNRRRLSSVQTYRGTPALWTAPPGSSGYDGSTLYGAGNRDTFQLLLEDKDFTYDSVDNPTEIRDWRLASEWPAGAKPVTRKVKYDDLYRLTETQYQYEGGDDLWVDPFDAEDTSPGNTDARRAKPVPHQSFARRVLKQTFKYDWLGNTVESDDDAHGFYDRSLGAVTNGTANAGPYQLKSATNAATASTSPSHKGELSAIYDPAGNLKSMVVRRGSGAGEAPCLPAGATCWHRFVYDWDEVGRLVEARRWDLPRSGAPNASDAVPAATADVDLRYAYDASDFRTLKTAVSAGEERHTVYVFDSVELRRTHYQMASGEPSPDFERSTTTEAPYLSAGAVRLARLVYEVDDPAVSADHLHVLLEVGDHLGSTAAVLDKAASELVEASTYLSSGAAEGDYRPGRWRAFREDYRFTGKEEDMEVGLQYFGKRFLSPYIGRWASTDPLAVHSSAEGDLNLFAYVHGHLLKAVDPVGLDLNWFQRALDAVVNPSNSAARGVTDALAERGEATVTGVVQSAKAIAHGDFRPVVAIAKGIVTSPVTSAIDAGKHTVDAGKSIARGDTSGAVKHVTHSALSVADAISGGAGLAGMAKGAASRVGVLGKVAPKAAAAEAAVELAKGEMKSATSEAATSGGAIVKYDGQFAARQILGQEPVTPGGRAIMSHAAERMVQPPTGRAPMTMSEVDQVLDSADRIRKVSPHPDGTTITVQSTTMPGKPQVVVDAATGTRVITVVKKAK